MNKLTAVCQWVKVNVVPGHDWRGLTVLSASQQTARLMLALTLLLSSQVASSAEQGGKITGGPAYQVVGSGQYSYWFWDLYQAKLSTTSGKFTDYRQSAPVLLELTYLRDISKKDFLDATIEQWRLQSGGVLKQHKVWAGELNKLWLDVKKGDTLAAELLADGRVNFYFNQQLLGPVADPAFGPVFFDIWLSEKTTAPELRQALLANP